MFRLPASPAMTKNVQIAGFASNDVSTSSFPSLPRESVSIWHTQPLSECILRHITRPRWQCLHFHLARSTLVRAHSKAHHPPQVAMLTLPPGTPNPCQSAFRGTSPAPGGNAYTSTWHTQPLLECILRHITCSRWQCLHFHLARSTLVRAHSEAHHSPQVAMLTLPSGTVNRLPCFAQQ